MAHCHRGRGTLYAQTDQAAQAEAALAQGEREH
jgi:hypothetical protein